MSSSELLASRAIACTGWRWMPGMLTDVGERVADPTICYLGTLPDLSDPLTVLALLLLVREALGCPEAHVYYADLSRRWVVRWGYEGLGVRTVDGATEAEALVAALEAAP